jgi:riboflavin synthase
MASSIKFAVNVNHVSNAASFLMAAQNMHMVDVNTNMKLTETSLFAAEMKKKILAALAINRARKRKEALADLKAKTGKRAKDILGEYMKTIGLDVANKNHLKMIDKTKIIDWLLHRMGYRLQ